MLLHVYIHECNLDSIFKSRDITLPTKVRLVKAMVFPVVMYEYESWTVKKAEHQRIDAFELWCWRKLLRVHWTERRSNQSILKEINTEYSLEGLMLKLKLQYFGHLMWRADHWKRPWFCERLKAREEPFPHIHNQHTHHCIISVQLLSCVQLFATPWTACSMPDLPVHHQLPEFTQTHAHWVGDAIQPSHPLLSPSPPAPNLSQHQGLFKWVSSPHQVAKVLEFQLQHQSFQWTPRTDLL